MRIDTCFLLSAGKGTRMGEVGKLLPKPLWPIFDSTLIDIQISYLRKLGISKFYINSHHHDGLIQEHFENDKTIEIVYEEKLLDSGGGVNNLVKAFGEKEGFVLTCNSDAFNFLSIEEIDKAINSIGEAEISLFLNRVDQNEEYAEVVCEKNVMKDIAPKKMGDFYTYSGSCIINLETFQIKEGVSNFFDSVANWKTKIVKTTKLENMLWDFGTKELFFKNCFEAFKLIGSNEKTPKASLVKSHFSINTDKVFSNSYNSSYKDVLNFGTEAIDFKSKAIIFGNPEEDKGQGIYLNETRSVID